MTTVVPKRTRTKKATSQTKSQQSKPHGVKTRLKDINGRQHAIIEHVKPELDGGQFPIKRIVGDTINVEADIFTDGHNALEAVCCYRFSGENAWQETPMKPIDNDRWQGEFAVERCGEYEYTFLAWVDLLLTWELDFKKRIAAQQDVSVELLIGAELVEKAAGRAAGNDAKALKQFAGQLRGKNLAKAIETAQSEDLKALTIAYPDRSFAKIYDRILKVTVDETFARFSSWYELFPRSWSKTPGKHGTFKDIERILPELQSMGFDVLYFPPIHPIGFEKRKGKNNALETTAEDPGSPWAIGSPEGGHKDILKALGGVKDFENLIKKAAKQGIRVAMDIAFQCAPDHPYVKSHPEWFRWRPDGTVQYAENPPKKYQDILPINYESEDWQNLWLELKSIFEFWIEKGIKIFRVDNPHTKPFIFWYWLINELKQTFPDTVFLAEAFTRPKVMQRLAKGGFSQSYTYFTWRNTKKELEDYLTELTQTELKEYFRPNFWPNTPDILHESLQKGGKPMFISRLVLAATLSSNYGIYGPAYELCINEPVAPDKEEYLNSEKYEIKSWNRNDPGSIRDVITRVNRIRLENRALQTTDTIRFLTVNATENQENQQLIAYLKTSEDKKNRIMVIVNLDPKNVQSGWVQVPVRELGLEHNRTYIVHDLLSSSRYHWQGEWNYIELNPFQMPAHILRMNNG